MTTEVRLSTYGIGDSFVKAFELQYWKFDTVSHYAPQSQELAVLLYVCSASSIKPWRDISSANHFLAFIVRYSPFYKNLRADRHIFDWP